MVAATSLHRVVPVGCQTGGTAGTAQGKNIVNNKIARLVAAEPLPFGDLYNKVQGGAEVSGKLELAPLAPLHGTADEGEERGSVDGVTRKNTLTEDGMSPTEGDALILEIRRLTGFIRD